MRPLPRSLIIVMVVLTTSSASSLATAGYGSGVDFTTEWDEDHVELDSGRVWSPDNTVGAMLPTLRTAPSPEDFVHVGAAEACGSSSYCLEGFVRLVGCHAWELFIWEGTADGDPAWGDGPHGPATEGCEPWRVPDTVPTLTSGSFEASKWFMDACPGEEVTLHLELHVDGVAVLVETVAVSLDCGASAAG